MRDGPARTSVKAIARWFWTLDLRTTRVVRDVRSPPRYKLLGSCEGCGRCCEEPSIQVGRLVWALPTLRWLWLAWQRHINGFVKVGAQRQGRYFRFRCTHYDPNTRACDSYHSRPGMCRDYPRALLRQPWPDLFDECSHSVVATNAPNLREALAQTELTEAERRALEEKLLLVGDDSERSP